ncbi:MAG: hypothetical protein D6674_05395 [Acidobacteria bacterium]|jgi:hypothetical protein|nr:MAG: hypothetical protein D6674_05395 [Acidobacteriota bacterium]
MKRLLFLLFLLMSCAPLLCPDEDGVRRDFSQFGAPQEYRAQLSVRYGLLRMPIRLEKTGGRFIIGDGERSIELQNLCINSVCFDLPITPDGLIFGKLLRGDEKASCGREGFLFTRDEGPFESRYVFKDGKPALAEFYDKKKERRITLEYLDWAPQGYARALRLKQGGISLLLTVDDLKF